MIIQTEKPSRFDFEAGPLARRKSGPEKAWGVLISETEIAFSYKRKRRCTTEAVQTNGRLRHHWKPPLYRVNSKADEIHARTT